MTHQRQAVMVLYVAMLAGTYVAYANGAMGAAWRGAVGSRGSASGEEEAANEVAAAAEAAAAVEAAAAAIVANASAAVGGGGVAAAAGAVSVSVSREMSKRKGPLGGLGKQFAKVGSWAKNLGKRETKPAPQVC